MAQDPKQKQQVPQQDRRYAAPPLDQLLLGLRKNYFTSYSPEDSVDTVPHIIIEALEDIVNQRISDGLKKLIPVHSFSFFRSSFSSFAASSASRQVLWTDDLVFCWHNDYVGQGDYFCLS